MNRKEGRRTGRLFCLLTKHICSLPIPDEKHSNMGSPINGRRVSLCASPKGSLTLEAALALPLLLCAITALLYVFAFTASQAREYRALAERAQFLGAAAGCGSFEEPYICLYDYRTVALPFSSLSGKKRQAVQRVEVRAWVGYTGETFAESSQEQMVYVTSEGSVYHRSRDCSYLLLTVRPVSFRGLTEERNQSGGKYMPCEYCVKSAFSGGIVYITDYGASYHSRRDCQGLKRTVMAIPLSKTGGMPCCSRCGAF